MGKDNAVRLGGHILDIPPGPRLGELVVEAKGLSKAYGEKLMFENLNFNLPQGGIVGIYVARDVDFSSVYELKPTAGALPREGAQ